jgi:hypothetical protein
MQNKSDSLKAWSEVVKNIAQVIAVVIAGLWTVYLFNQQEAPTLELRGTIDSNLTWAKLANSDNCEAVMRVTFENKGKSSIDIGEVHVRGWKYRQEKADTVFADYLDLEKVQNEGELFFDKTYNVGGNSAKENLPLPFIQHYPPGTAYTHNFSWIITPEQSTQVLFFVQLFAEDGKSQPPWNTYTWGSIGCKG